MKTVDKMLRANPAIAPDCLWFNNREINIIESSVQCNPTERERKRRIAKKPVCNTWKQKTNTSKRKYTKKLKFKATTTPNKIYENNQSPSKRYKTLQERCCKYFHIKYCKKIKRKPYQNPKTPPPINRKLSTVHRSDLWNTNKKKKDIIYTI